MTVQRYDFDTGHDVGGRGCGMHRSKFGSYVKYSDHDAALQAAKSPTQSAPPPSTARAPCSRRYEWINVNDSLPDMYVSVLVCINGVVWIADRGRTDDGWAWYTGISDYDPNVIIWWTPLPSPPTAETVESPAQSAPPHNDTANICLPDPNCPVHNKHDGHW